MDASIVLTEEYKTVSYIITLYIFYKMGVYRCWRKLYAKETLHLQGEYSVIIYNCFHEFDETWAKALQKAIFSMDSVQLAK